MKEKQIKAKQIELLETFTEGKKQKVQKEVAPKKTKNIETRWSGATPKESRQEFFIPISGFVWLYPEEIEVVNHPMFQRLGNIYQLGQTYLVYRGATHKRIEHAIGTLHIAHRIIASIKYTHKKALGRGARTAHPITEYEERFIRLGALLHDIGHVAVGHTLEDELCVICKHDSDQRLDMIFNNKDRRSIDQYERSLSELIDVEFDSYIPSDLKDVGFKASTITRLLIRKPPAVGKIDDLQYWQDCLNNCNEIRLGICRDIIGNTICADLLDYLYRDWYHIGKPKTFDERILQYMEIKPEPGTYSVTEPPPKHTDKFVISLREAPKIRTDAISAILDLLESRYHLAESVLFHRTKIAATAMLDRALFELWQNNSEEIETFIHRLSDEQLITECLNIAQRKRNEVSAYILDCIVKRQLFKAISIISFGEFQDRDRNNVQRLYGGDNYDDRRELRKNRIKTLRLLEDDFQLKSGSLAMYCPIEGMNVKIANVRIAVDNEIESFNTYERKNENKLSGGHLDAQVDRFKRLWKIYFFIDRKEGQKIELIKGVFQEVVRKLALGCFQSGENPYDTCERLAQNLISNKASPWYGYEISPEIGQAVYNDDDAYDLQYPCGVFKLSSFLKKKDEK